MQEVEGEGHFARKDGDSFPAWLMCYSSMSCMATIFMPLPLTAPMDLQSLLPRYTLSEVGMATSHLLMSYLSLAHSLAQALCLTCFGCQLWEIWMYFQGCLWKTRQRVTESNPALLVPPPSLFSPAGKVAWARGHYTQVLTKHLR